MPPKRGLIHKGIVFAVEAAELPGLFRFRFEIADKEVRGRVKTGLVGMAVKRARSAIDRKIRLQREYSPVVRSTTPCSSAPTHTEG
jgi:hypothetical protein